MPHCLAPMWGPQMAPQSWGAQPGLGPLLPPPILVDLGLGKALSSWSLPLPLSPRGRLSVVKFGEMSPQVLETIRRMASENLAFSRWSWVRAAPPTGPPLPPGKAWTHLVLAPGLPVSHRHWSSAPAPCSRFTSCWQTLCPKQGLKPQHLPQGGREGGREPREEGKERGKERGRGEPHHALDPVERLPGKLSSTGPQSWVFTWVPEALGPAGQGLPPTLTPWAGLRTQRCGRVCV